MRVGIISITSMPSWGGAEIYFNRLHNLLLRENIHSTIISSTPEHENYDNGSGNYIRIVPDNIQAAIKKQGMKHGMTATGTPLGKAFSQQIGFTPTRGGAVIKTDCLPSRLRAFK